MAVNLGPSRRQYLLVGGAFGALLLVSFGLFAYLLVEQLSKSYLEDVLLSGEQQARELARAMEGEASVYQVVEKRRQELVKFSEALSRQEVVESVQVFDNLGKLVWQTTTSTAGYLGGFPEPHAELVAPMAEPDIVERERRYEIRVPFQDIGTVVVSMSKPAMQERIGVLRRRLLLSTVLAAGIGALTLIGAITFISHLVNRNAELERRRRLDEELAALGSLAANLAHEIRNPLNALSINLELLEEDLGTGSGETVGLARREVGRLSRLVNDFLTYARPASPSLEASDAGALIEEVARLLRPAAERAGVALTVITEPAAIRGDRAQLTQVLVNLALNAVQAMDGYEPRELELACRAGEGRVVLEVRDSGPGIPAAELEKVREAFYSLRKGGTGLGLAIAERIVDAHGGVLELENLPERGLSARVVLPASGPAAGA